MRIRIIVVVLAVAQLLLPQSASHAQCQYDAVFVEGIDCVFWTQGYSVTAINEHGTVAGSYNRCNGDGDMPFIWHSSTGRIDLPIPDGYDTARANDLNNHGVVVGSASRQSPAPYEIAVAWVDGDLHVIGLLDGDNRSEAIAVNDHGVVVGRSNDAVHGGLSGFRWSLRDGLSPVDHPDGETLIALRDINDAGVMVGLAYLPGPFNQRGIVVDGDEITMLEPIPGGISSELYQINDAGEMFGSGFVDGVDTPLRRMAIWRGGNASLLIPESMSTDQVAGEMNRWGQVVGWARQEVGGWPFVADARGVRSLSDWAEVPDGLSYIGTPRCINDIGVIVNSHADGAMILTPRRISGDVTADCRVGFADLIAILATWGSCDVPCNADLDGNQQVGVNDLLKVLTHWTP